MNRALAEELGLRVGDGWCSNRSVPNGWTLLSWSGTRPAGRSGGGGRAGGPRSRTGRLHTDEERAVPHCGLHGPVPDQVLTRGFVNTVSPTRGWRRWKSGRASPPAPTTTSRCSSRRTAAPRGCRTAWETIAAALRLVAAMLGVAALAAIGLLTVRLARDVAVDRATSSDRLDGRDAMRLAIVALAPAVLVGVVVGMVIGIVASPSTSVGLAAAVDPAGGAIVLDRVFVAAGGLVATALMAAFVGIGAIRASRSKSTVRATTHVAPPLERPLPIALRGSAGAVRHDAGAGSLRHRRWWRSPPPPPSRWPP